MADLLQHELSRTFSTTEGRISSCIDVGGGHTALATLYVAKLADPLATLAAEITRLRAEAAAVRAKMIAAGWNDN